MWHSSLKFNLVGHIPSSFQPVEVFQGPESVIEHSDYNSQLYVVRIRSACISFLIQSINGDSEQNTDENNTLCGIPGSWDHTHFTFPSALRKSLEFLSAYSEPLGDLILPVDIKYYLFADNSKAHASSREYFPDCLVPELLRAVPFQLLRPRLRNPLLSDPASNLLVDPAQ